MPRIVRCGLIQAKNVLGPEAGLPAIKKAMIAKHLKLIAEAAKKKAKILCLQEIFYGPYFCAEQETRWYHLTERIPDGPTVTLMRKLAKKYKMVMVIPIYEEEQAGVYYNTAAVIDADGKYLGK
jgi:beta-ureidopropionase